MMEIPPPVTKDSLKCVLSVTTVIMTHKAELRIGRDLVAVNIWRVFE